MGRKDVLPDPFVRSIGIFPFQRVGKKDRAVAFFEVHFVDTFHTKKMLLEGVNQRLGEDRGAVLASFGVVNEKLSAFKIDILHAQPEALTHAQAASVENLADEKGCSLHAGKHKAGFFA